MGILRQGQVMSSLYITVRETAQIMAVSEKKVMDLIESGNLQAYKIADQFLRLKRNEVVNMVTTGKVVSENAVITYTPAERMADFFYFNDFYLISLIVIGALLYIIFFTY